MFRLTIIGFATLSLVACGHPAAPPAPATTDPGSGASDTIEARRVFEASLDAIHRHDRAAYLSHYLQSDRLTRNGPTGITQGWDKWPARNEESWPETLVVRDVRVMPIRPGLVYGSYYYRGTQNGVTTEGTSERVIIRTPDGWKIAVSTAFTLPAASPPPPLALIGGTLVNPGARPVPDAVVLIRNGRIVCAGASGTGCTAPPGVERVDTRGAFLSPGLIDAHVHYSQTGWVDGRPDAVDLRATFPYDSVVSALRDHPERFDRAYLCTGVTSVFDVGGYPWTETLAHEHELSLTAPRVAAAGPLLSTIDHWVNTAAERQFIYMKDDSTVRAAVRANARGGAAAIKVWYIQLPDSMRARARALLMAAGDEAHRVGLPLIVHATELAGAKDALAAGAKVLVHSVGPEDVDDAFLAMAARNHTIVIPTLTVLEGYADVIFGRSPGARYPMDCVDPVTRAHLESPTPSKRGRSSAFFAPGGGADSIFKATERNVRRMRDAGIEIAVGTDAGNPGTAHGPSMYREMEALQHGGMPASAVFSSATLVAAKAMGRERELGSLEAGKLADVVVFDADPTADIANARRVRWVVRGGALYGRAELLPRH